MIYFHCDYVEGGHPKILERMVQTNMEQLPGYSTDHYCDTARQLIREACGREDADVHFLVGGTQTNLIAISSILRPYQGVIAAYDGHIACHETGAIEATGHKVLPIPCNEGIITGQQERDHYHSHVTDSMREHTVQPGMVYVSFPTEMGTLYTKEELTDLSNACHECGIPLYIDGARLGYGLTSPKTDLTLKEIANLCDMFYIGGTKCGALMGEALVILNDKLKDGFRYIIKQHGGLLAKGRLLGLQFETLFTDNLYFDICKHAVEQAMQIRHAFEEKGVEMYTDSYTNQQFVIIRDDWMHKLAEKYTFETWEKYDADHTVIRFCTSWATKDENVAALVHDIAAL